MKNILLRLFAFQVLLFISQLYANEHQELYFVDAHSQIDHQVSGIEVVLEKMANNNVDLTLLALRGKRDWMDPIRWSAAYPDKIIPFVRSKGRHFQNNTKRYYKEVNRQIKRNEFRGVAEILIYHAKKWHKAPEVDVRLTDDRVRHLLGVALSNDWPFIIHIEFASLNGGKRVQYMNDLKDLLNKHPSHPFALIHMGQLQSNQIRELIAEHSNLYFITSHSDPITVDSSSQPWVNLFDGFQFKKDWKKLFNEHPEKFIFALDNVFADHWENLYGAKMEYWKKALSKIPSRNAHLIAHGNAERLWKLR